jgi:hypothetical protein
LSAEASFCYDEEETYAKALDSENKGRKGKKVASIRFKGRAEAWRRMFANTLPRQHTFYRLIVFPYIERLPLIGARLLPYGIDPGSVPPGTIRFWHNAAKELVSFLNNNYRGGESKQSRPSS